MQRHIDFGVIPYRRDNTEYLFLVIQHQAGHWSFPKGHQEPGEAGHQTAQREIAEETGLKVRKLDQRRSFDESYTWTHDNVQHQKSVTYFLGEIENQPLKIQTMELRDARWLPYEQALAQLTYRGTRLVLEAAHDFLSTNK